jgi:F0F1-type ATP synthase membrane subunit b/b'
MKNYTQLLSISLMLFAILALGSCGGKMTKKAVKKGDVFKASIEDFEKNRQKFAVQVSETIEDANEALADEEPNTEDISTDFEKEWNKIQTRYKKMKKDFEDVRNSSNAYFEHLDELANGINNEKMRTTELKKNTELQIVWEKQYVEAEKSIQAVDQVLIEGNDFHRVLLLSSVRDKIQQNIDNLNDLSKQADSLLKDLEAFTEAGRELASKG